MLPFYIRLSQFCKIKATNEIILSSLIDTCKSFAAITVRYSVKIQIPNYKKNIITLFFTVCKNYMNIL